MKSPLAVVILGTLLLLPFSAAYAQAPSLSPISDTSMNAGDTLAVNVVAVDANGDAITVTSSLPAFATLDPPTTGTGSVVTTLTLAPTAGDVGTFPGSVYAAAGGESDTTTFQITVAAAGSNHAPAVTAPALLTATEAIALAFTVAAVDADADVITSLSALGLPTGATFTPNGTYTSGTFSWTPSLTQAGDYDVVFTAVSGLSEGGATTHIRVENAVELSIAELGDVTLLEGTTLTVSVNVTGPAGGSIDLTSSLPAFATLNAPTTGTGTLATTITLAPPIGSAGSHSASITATGSGQTDTEGFTITVSPAAQAALEAKASLIGNFNTHRKFICFRVQPVNGSFEVRNISLSDITLEFRGSAITALTGKTHVSLDCDEDDEAECDDCENDSLNCEPQLHACFSMPAIQGLFDDASVPDSLVNATVNGTLTTGETFVATIGPKFPGNNANQGNKGEQGKKGLNARVRPNPVNPTAELTFRLTQPGRIHVRVFDLQGRLVKTLLDENRPVGDQSVTWNGSNSRNGSVPSGVYYFRIQTPQGEEVQRVTVLK